MQSPGDEDNLQRMATHGRVGEFNSQREDWMSYTKRLQEYFTANEIKSADKMKAILLSIVGAKIIISAHAKLSSSRQAD